MHSIVVGLLISGAAVGQASGPAAESPRDGVIYWNRVALDAIRADRTPPPKAARALAMMHVAIQDAVNSIYQTYRPYLVNYRTPAGTSPDAALSVAAHCILSNVYPNQSARFDRALDTAMATLPANDDRTAGIRLGHEVAKRVLAWRARDGSDRTVLYRPRDGADFWQPTPPDFRAPLLPQWGHVTPFAIRSPVDFRPPPPPKCDTKEFARSLEEVRTLGGARSAARTPDQTEIASFWLDGEGSVTPPGHWNQVAQIGSEIRGLSLAENARLFALLNMALADAAIACWDAKFSYDYVRPVTAIRRADQDGNPDTWADPTWTPLLPTPPFPSYTSGHSTFSSSAAAVLADVLGDDVRFTVGGDDLPNVRRSFARFSDASAEAGRSRIYGGIHYDFDDQEAQKVGAALGRYVARNFMIKQ